MVSREKFSYIAEECIDKNLFCPVCHRPYEDPRSFVCRHVFCNDCITKSKQDNFVNCFLCQTKIPYQSLDLVNYPLQNMLNKLRIKCSICGESQLERGAFEDHLFRGCAKPISSSSRKSENSCSEVEQQNSTISTFVDANEQLPSFDSSTRVQPMPTTSQNQSAVDSRTQGNVRTRLISSTSSTFDDADCVKCRRNGCLHGSIISYYGGFSNVAYPPKKCRCSCHKRNINVKKASKKSNN